MTVLSATQDHKQDIETLPEVSMPLDISPTFQFDPSYQATALARSVHPSLGISEDVDLTWPSMATNTLYNQIPEGQPTRVSRFSPLMSADIPFDFQKIDPESFRDPNSLRLVVRQLANTILMGRIAEAMPSIDKLDSFLVSDLVQLLANFMGIAPIPHRSRLPPGAHPEFEFLLNSVRKQRQKEMAQRPPMADKQVRLPQLVNNPYYPYDLCSPPIPPSPLPHLTYTIHDGQATTAAHRIVVSPTPSTLADCSHLHTLEANQTHLTEDTAPLVPKPIPEELQALIDAYVFGKPLTVISSHRRLRDHWLLHLPTAYGYVVMGFFKIIGIEETRVLPSELKPTLKTSPDFISGQVRWRFRLLWSPGGEEGVWPKRTEELNYPWWSLPVSMQKGVTSVIKDDKDDKELPPDPEDGFPTTLQYRELRQQNPEFQWRFQPVQELYHYLFPPHLLMPFSAQTSDLNFPRGWICPTCGRMNFQKAMRHRKCPGSQCKVKYSFSINYFDCSWTAKNSKPVSYYLDLFLLRAPQDRLTLSLPYNVYPHAVTVKRITWEEGTQTFTCFMPNEEKPTSYINHIFTGNLPHLQVRANEWLQKVQLELEIVRKPGDNGVDSVTFCVGDRHMLIRS